MRHILTSVRAAVMLALVAGTISVAGSAEAAPGFTDGDFVYSLNGDGVSVSLAGYAGDSTDVVVPDSVTHDATTYTVTVVGDEALDAEDLGFSLTSVVIPDSVVTIGERALYANTDLTQVTLGTGLVSIGDYAFSGADYQDQELANQLTSLTIPDSVTTIGAGAFAGDLALADLSLGTSVTTIGAEAFIYGSLTSVTIPDSVTTIGESAFYYNSVTTATIGDHVTDIGASAFAHNNDLATVTLTGLPPTITDAGETGSFGTGGSDEVVPLTIYYNPGTGYPNPWHGYHTHQTGDDDGSFTDGDFVYSLNGDGVSVSLAGYAGDSTDVVVPDSVTHDATTYTVTVVGDEALDAEDLGFSLTSVVIPDSVVTIGERALYANTDLTQVTLGTGLVSIGDYAFSGADYQDQELANQLTSLTIPDSVTTIGAGAFAGDLALADLSLGTSVTTIGAEAFIYGSLTSVTIPDSVTTIGESAFYYNSVTTATIGDHVTDIGASAFAHNNDLATVTLTGLPPTITDAGETGSFGTGGSDEVVPLTIYYNPGTGYPNPWHGYHTHQTGDDDGSFTDGDFVYSLNGDGVSVSLAGYAGDSTDVVVPDSVTHDATTYTVTVVGDEALDAEDLGFSLTSVVIPDSVVTIGERALYANTDLTQVTLGTGLVSIGDYAFSGADYQDQELANQLTSLTIPDSVTTIGAGAFAGDLALADLSLGTSVTTIGAEAFIYGSLTSVTIPDSVTTIGESAFYYNSVTTATIGDHVTDIGASAFAHNNDLATVTLTGLPPTITDAGETGSFGTGGSDEVVPLTIYYNPGTGYPNPWHGYHTHQTGDDGTPSATESVLSVSGGSVVADGSATHDAQVIVRDASDDPLPGITVDFAVSPGANLSAATAVSGSDGVASVAITSTTAGHYQVSARISGDDVADSPQSVAFVAGAASAVTSTIATSAATIVANGTDGSTITVTTRDLNHNPLTSSGGVVTVSSTIGSVSAVTDDNDGSYTARLTATGAGTATLSFTINGVPASQTTSVSVQAVSSTPTPTVDPVAPGHVAALTVHRKQSKKPSVTWRSPTSGGTVKRYVVTLSWHGHTRRTWRLAATTHRLVFKGHLLRRMQGHPNLIVIQAVSPAGAGPKTRLRFRIH